MIKKYVSFINNLMLFINQLKTVIIIIAVA